MGAVMGHQQRPRQSLCKIVESEADRGLCQLHHVCVEIVIQVLRGGRANLQGFDQLFGSHAQRGAGALHQAALGCDIHAKQHGGTEHAFVAYLLYFNAWMGIEHLHQTDHPGDREVDMFQRSSFLTDHLACLELNTFALGLDAGTFPRW